MLKRADDGDRPVAEVDQMARHQPSAFRMIGHDSVVCDAVQLAVNGDDRNTGVPEHPEMLDTAEGARHDDAIDALGEQHRDIAHLVVHVFRRAADQRLIAVLEQFLFDGMGQDAEERHFNRR